MSSINPNKCETSVKILFRRNWGGGVGVEVGDDTGKISKRVLSNMKHKLYHLSTTTTFMTQETSSPLHQPS